MCMYVYVCMCEYIYIYIYIYIIRFMCICMHAFMYVCMYNSLAHSRGRGRDRHGVKPELRRDRRSASWHNGTERRRLLLFVHRTKLHMCVCLCVSVCVSVWSHLHAYVSYLLYVCMRACPLSVSVMHYVSALQT